MAHALRTVLPLAVAVAIFPVPLILSRALEIGRGPCPESLASRALG